MSIRLVAAVSAAALTAAFGVTGASASGPPTPTSGLTAPTSEQLVESPALRAAHTDFDGDGRDDLAVGIALEGVVVAPPAIDGAYIDYSSALPSQLLAPAAPDAGGGAPPPLASGDFDGDGFDDLAMARPFDSVPRAGGGRVFAGSVWIFEGGPSGLDPTGTQIHQDTPGIPGSNELSDWWGFSLATGDVNHDGRDDLAIGAPRESIGSVRTAGAVTVLRGSPTGLSTGSAKQFSQSTAGVPSAPERDDYFGVSVAISDVTGGGKADLLIASKEDLFGGVTMLRGSSSGITATGSDQLTAEQLGSGAVNLGDMPVVAAGDTNGDGRAEVIVGFPTSTIGPSTSGGAIVSIVGRSTGLSVAGRRIFHQNSSGVPEVAEEGDGFGASLAVGDLTGDGRADVVIGIPGENKYHRVNVGAFILLKGSSSGLTASGSQYFDQNTPGVPGTAETRDEFADVVSLLDPDGDHRMDAVIGDQWEDAFDAPFGTATVFRGTSSGLTPSTMLTAADGSTDEVVLTQFGGSIVH